MQEEEVSEEEEEEVREEEEEELSEEEEEELREQSEEELRGERDEELLVTTRVGHASFRGSWRWRWWRWCPKRCLVEAHGEQETEGHKCGAPLELEHFNACTVQRLEGRV